MMVEAFNKAQSAWVRRQLEGINQLRQGNESSTRKIDDLKVILTDTSLTMANKELYYESTIYPVDYLQWCRISAKAWRECCPARPLTIFEGNEADRDIYLADTNRTPNYEWATTFATCIGNTFRVYTNDQFEIREPVLTYYRNPNDVVFAGQVDPSTGDPSPVDILCEFPDNVVELIIDDTVALLSSDMDNYQKAQYMSANAEKSN